eukprot:scaffold272763_cov18-Tisochrysis_lutea.AAC.1
MACHKHTTKAVVQLRMQPHPYEVPASFTADAWVPNITGSSTTYEVMCDLDCISGPETVNMSSSQASSYKAGPPRGWGLKQGTKLFGA